MIEAASTVVTIDGSSHPFFYPARGRMEEFVRHILDGQEYELPRTDAWAPRTVVDIGANVGAFSMFCRGRFPGVAVHAFEPSSEASEYCRRNFAPYRDMQVHRMALLDFDGTATLYHGTDRSSQSSLIDSPQTLPSGEAVPVAEVGAVFRRLGIEHISILKIDTEGCEVPILRGLDPWLRITDLIHLEYHHDNDRRMLDALMAQYGHILWRARAVRPHVGNVAYISSAMALLMKEECRYAIQYWIAPPLSMRGE